MATTRPQERMQTADAASLEPPGGPQAHRGESNDSSEVTSDDDLDELAESPNSIFEGGAFANGEWFEATEVDD